MENQHNNTPEGQIPPAAPSQPTTSTQANSAPETSPAADNTTLMAVLCYIGPLVIIPFLVAKEQPFVRYHILQGLVLFSGELIVYVIGSFFMLGYMLAPVIMIANLIFLILSIIGIVNVINKKQAPVPLTGQFAKHFESLV